MNRMIRTVLLGSAALMAAPLANAGNEVMATMIHQGRGVAIAFDIASDGNVSGFDFRVEVPGIDAKSANITKCASELPKGFQGWCSVVGNSFNFIAVGDRMDSKLPAGVVSVGKVYLPQMVNAKGKEASVKLLDVNLNDAQGKALTASSKVVSE